MARERRKEGWQRLAHAALDLEQGAAGQILNPVEALLKLRLDLKQRGNFSCPHFDVAFTRYLALSRPRANIREAHPELFRSQSELVNDAVSIAGDVFGKIPDLGRTMIAVMKDSTELFKQFSDNDAFHRWLADTVFDLTYLQAAPETAEINGTTRRSVE